MASLADSGNSIGRPSVGEVLAAAFIVAWASQYSTKLKLASTISFNGCFFAECAHAFTSSAASVFASSSNSLIWFADGLVLLPADLCCQVSCPYLDGLLFAECLAFDFDDMAGF